MKDKKEPRTQTDAYGSTPLTDCGAFICSFRTLAPKYAPSYLKEIGDTILAFGTIIVTNMPSTP